jgi:hypothetical protein
LVQQAFSFEIVNLRAAMLRCSTAGTENVAIFLDWRAEFEHADVINSPSLIDSKS